MQIKPGKAGVQIHCYVYRRECHRKHKKWLLRRDYIKRRATTLRYPLSRFPKAADWEMEYIREIEQKAGPLRAETVYNVGLKRALAADPGRALTKLKDELWCRWRFAAREAIWELLAVNRHSTLTRIGAVPTAIRGTLVTMLFSAEGSLLYTVYVLRRRIGITAPEWVSVAAGSPRTAATG